MCTHNSLQCSRQSADPAGRDSKAMKTVLFIVSSLVLALANQDAKVTLEDGPTRNKGRVEVTLGGESPRQVCDANFDSDDTDALCQAAGFEDSVASISNYGVKGGVLFMEVECSSGTCTYKTLDSDYVCKGTALGLDCSPSLGVTGSIGLEAGIIAGILVCIVAVVGVGVGLSACLYRNDLIPCFQNSAA